MTLQSTFLVVAAVAMGTKKYFKAWNWSGREEGMNGVPEFLRERMIWLSRAVVL
jgi:hypothetical protein